MRIHIVSLAIIRCVNGISIAASHCGAMTSIVKNESM